MRNVNPEQMRYQKNNISFWLCIWALVLNVCAFVVAYTDDLLKPDIIIGFDIIINIVFMLLVFMGSEKSKAYVYEWGAILITIGAIQFVRVLIVPLIFFIKDSYTTTGFLLNISFLMQSGIALILSGAFCRVRSKILADYIIEQEAQEANQSSH